MEHEIKSQPFRGRDTRPEALYQEYRELARLQIAAEIERGAVLYDALEKAYGAKRDEFLKVGEQ